MRHSENTPSCTCTMEEESASFPAFLSVPPGARADKEDKPWVSSHPSPVRISSIGQRFRDSTAAVPNRSLCCFFCSYTLVDNLQLRLLFSSRMPVLQFSFVFRTLWEIIFSYDEPFFFFSFLFFSFSALFLRPLKIDKKNLQIRRWFFCFVFISSTLWK